MKYEPSPTDTAHDGKLYGVHSATITDTADPQNKARVKVTLNNRDDLEERWARVARGMAGGNYGMHFEHDVGSEVLVTFENGEIEAEPFVVGSLHNEDETAPSEINSQGDGKETVHQLKTKTGLKIALTDVGTAGNGEVPKLKVANKSSISISTNGGRNIVLDDGAGKVRVDDEFGNAMTMDKKGIKIKDTNGNSITMDKDGVHIDSPKETKVTSPKINEFGKQITIKGKKTTMKGSNFVDIEGGTADLHGKKRTTVSSDKRTTVKASKQTTVKSPKKTLVSGSTTTVKGNRTLTMQSPKTTVKGSQTMIMQGMRTTVKGKLTTIKGKLTSLKGKKTSITGKMTTVKGKKTSVLGKKTTVTGKKTTVLGKKTTILGKKTTVLGKKTSVLGRKASIAAQTMTIAGQTASIAGLRVSVSAGGQFSAKAPMIMLN